MDVADLIDPLSALVDRSLVVADDGRFRALETIRAYAEARLIESGEYEQARERHAFYYTALAERAEPELRGGEQAAWLALLRAEDANLRLAADWAREHADDHPDVAFRLAGSLGWYWYVGRQMEGRAQIRLTLAAGGAATAAVRARTLQALSLSARPAGCIVHPSDEAAKAARDSLALFADHDAQRAALSRLLLAVQGVADEDMRPHLLEVERARAALHAHDDAWGAALADFIEMEIRLHHGAVDDALPFGDRAAATFDELDDDWGRSAVRLHLGHGLRLAGRTDAAEQVLALAVQLSRATGLPNNLARSYVELGEAALYRGSADEADAMFEARGPDCRRCWQRDAACARLARTRCGRAMARRPGRCPGPLLRGARDLPRGRYPPRGGAGPHWHRFDGTRRGERRGRGGRTAADARDRSPDGRCEPDRSRRANSPPERRRRSATRPNAHGFWRRPTCSARSKVDPAAPSSSEMSRRQSARARQLPIRRRRLRRRVRRCPSSR